MKISKIKNAYINNKPNFNYEIHDVDGQLVAKGHLLNAKERERISKHTQFQMIDGKFEPKIESYVDMATA